MSASGDNSGSCSWPMEMSGCGQQQISTYFRFPTGLTCKSGRDNPVPPRLVNTSIDKTVELLGFCRHGKGTSGLRVGHGGVCQRCGRLRDHLRQGQAHAARHAPLQFHGGFHRHRIAFDEPAVDQGRDDIINRERQVNVTPCPGFIKRNTDFGIVIGCRWAVERWFSGRSQKDGYYRGGILQIPLGIPTSSRRRINRHRSC